MFIINRLFTFTKATNENPNIYVSKEICDAFNQRNGFQRNLFQHVRLHDT